MKLAENLKKAVLQAAMQGKLTRQLKTDSSVYDLLQKIAEEKEINNQVWKAKKQPPIEEILETIDANEIPENWKWVKLSQVAHSYIGLTYSPSNISSNGTIVLRSSNIQNGKMDYKDIVKVEMDIPENKMCKKGDILVCARNGSKSLVGKCAIIDADGMSFGAFMAIIKSPCNAYLYHYLSSPYFKKQMALDSSTVTVNQITQDMLFNACVPLPPIEEQQRIVEKLNSILPIIDEYGKEEDELVALSQNFPEDIKKSVLQSAMQGKLTKQLQTDSSVDDLLKKIAEEKETLIKEGKIKKEKPLAEITEEEIPFEIPENWRWCRLGELFVFINGDRGKNYPAKTTLKSEGVIPFISAVNFSNYTLRNDNLLYLTEKQFDSLGSGKLKFDDIVLCIRGSLGKFCRYPLEMGAIASSLVIMRAINSQIIDYICNYLQSIVFFGEITRFGNGAVQPNLAASDVGKFLVPLPPIEEQQRIVEKLNSILPIIDNMAVYGTKKKAGRPKQEEALSFIRTFLQAQKPAQPKAATPEILELKTKAKQELPATVQKYAGLMGVTYNRITIRHQKTRWGSCTKTGNLNFNCLIMKMPDQVRDYVIIHELAHRKELNHSSKYWTIVAEYCPWYKQAKQWLKDNGQELMER